MTTHSIRLKQNVCFKTLTRTLWLSLAMALYTQLGAMQPAQPTLVLDEVVQETSPFVQKIRQERGLHPNHQTDAKTLPKKETSSHDQKALQSWHSTKRQVANTETRQKALTGGNARTTDRSRR